MGFGNPGRTQRSSLLFVCLLFATCLLSVSECWTLESSSSSETKNFKSEDLDSEVSKNGDSNIINRDGIPLQIAAGLKNRVEENDGGSHKLAWSDFEKDTVQLKSDDGDMNRQRELTLDGLNRDNNWCGTMRNRAAPHPSREAEDQLRIVPHQVFGFPLHDEQNNWPDFKLTWRTVSAIFLGGCGAALSSAGGLGGGALFVPLFNLLLQFDAKTSAALSNFLILGGSLANLYRNIREAHPSVDHKPLIDFDVVVLLQPNMLLGISTGVILNVVLPDWVVTLLLTIALLYMSQHSFKCGLRRWKKETCQNRLRLTKSPSPTKPPLYVPAPDFHLDDGSSSSEEDGCENGDEESTDVIDRNGNKNGEKTGDANELCQPLLSKEVGKMTLPGSSILTLAFTWLAFLAVQVVRNNESILGVKPCGVGYWLITSTQIPIAICITTWTISRIHAAHACKETPECHQEEGFVLKPESCMQFAWVALITGMLGGLLGIGGGTFINPILLTVGMIPQVTAATCASMVFFSSSMSVVQFWLMGRVPIHFALSGAVICAISSFVGVTMLHRAIAKYNRASLIVFSVTGVMALSAVLMAGFGGLGIWQEYDSGIYMGFHYPC